jgi:hypothetical protein
MEWSRGEFCMPEEKAMRVVAMLLILVTSLGGANAQKTKCVPTTTPPRDKTVRLQLTTTVANSRYSVEDGFKLLFFTLSLDYLNVGNRPILIDRKSSQIYRKIVTKDVKALAACKYLYDGTKDTRDNLHPGNYVLQVRVAAWFYFADPAEYEQKWGNEAYLWSENVTSEPMAFTIEKR